MDRQRTQHDIFARLIGSYADQSESDQNSDEARDLVIPEDLTSLSDEDLNELRDRAVAAFDGVYDTDQSFTDEDLEVLANLTSGIEALNAEVTSRTEAAQERASTAEELAARVRPLGPDGVQPEDDEDQETAQESTEDAETSTEDEPEGESTEISSEPAEGAEQAEQQEAVVASAPRRRSEVRVPASRVRNRASGLPEQGSTSGTIRDVLKANGDGTGYSSGTGITWDDVGRIVDNRLTGFNESQYRMAAQRGQHLRQQHTVATIEKPVADDLQVKSADPHHIEDVLQRATSERRLEGGSLTASGGWCTPSETVYDMLEVESRDGLFDLPTISVGRGGINRTLGPDFADIFANPVGFHYTEAEDEAGDYDGAGGGSKPCYRVECPPFEEHRLEVDGVCISAGLLLQRSFPELIARTTRGVLVAHDHQMAARRLNAIVADSEAVTMPAAAGGAAAPLLSAIELQVEHMQYIRRLARGTTMEAVFPYWVHGALRADLANRQGVDLLSVSNAQINAWFSERGIRPQFVYNWQDLTGTAGSATAWPTEVDFLLYPAGTWVAGGENIISIDTLYDSVLLGTNDYTALFTEESWMTLKMGFDSRVVTVSLCTDGVTNAGVQMACDGSAPAAV